MFQLGKLSENILTLKANFFFLEHVLISRKKLTWQVLI